jgi:phosphoribosylanthranilate isomerase
MTANIKAKIKVCGVTRLEDIRLAASLAVHAIGLNLYPKSPRYVSPSQANELLRHFPPLLEPVAVCVEPGPDDLSRIQNELAIRTVQIHSHEPARLTKHLAGWRGGVILAHGIRDASDLERLTEAAAEWQDAGVRLSGVLVDARVDGLHGGTGKTAPWDVLANFASALPLILAGGLHPLNVAEAIRAVRPYAVDVASGIESAPGMKDHARMEAFVRAVQDC